MKYLCIDYGLKRVGLAVCDEAELFASPYATRENGEGKKATRRLLNDVVETIIALQIEGIVIGLPRDSSGQVSEMETRTRAFGAALTNALQNAKLELPVHWCDERFSTAQVLAASRASGQSQKQLKEAGGSSSVDARAAAVILQDFLDAKKLQSQDFNTSSEDLS